MFLYNALIYIFIFMVTTGSYSGSGSNHAGILFLNGAGFRIRVILSKEMAFTLLKITPLLAAGGALFA